VNERNPRAVACLIARDAGADYSTPFHSGMSRVIRHTCWIFKLFFTGEEIARPCARTSKLWHQLKLNTHAFLVNNSWHSYYRSSSLTVTIFSNNLLKRSTRIVLSLRVSCRYAWRLKIRKCRAADFRFHAFDICKFCYCKIATDHARESGRYDSK